MVLYLYKRCVCRRMWWKVIWIEEGGGGRKGEIVWTKSGGMNGSREEE